MRLVLCEICLASGDQARLKQRDMSAFYALISSAFDNIKDSLAWLCTFCWKRVSQCIHFIDMAKRSKDVLAEFPSESLLAGLKPTDLHPYKMRLLPHVEIVSVPADAALNHPAVYLEPKSDSGASSVLNNQIKAINLQVVSQPPNPVYQSVFLSYQPVSPAYQPVLPACQPVLPTYQPLRPACQPALPTCHPSHSPVLPTHQPDQNAPTFTDSNTNAKPVLVYTSSGYKLVDDPYSLMQVKQECGEIQTENCVRQEPEFVKMDIEIDEKEIIEGSIKSEPISAESDVSIKDATTSSDYRAQRFIHTYPNNDVELKWVEISEEEMLLNRDESRKKKIFMNRQYKCKDCIIGFLSEDRYLQHLILHYEDCGPFVCPVCNLRFLTEFEQRNHTTRHYLRFECRECGLRGADRKLMRTHYELMHQDNIYDCELCDERFRIRSMWKDHVENVHYNSRECKVCGKILCSKRTLKTHMNTHDDTLGVECPVCHKKVRYLKNHMRIHNMTADPDAYCAECDVHFKNIYLYKGHLKYNKKHAKPEFQCAHCDRKCYTKATMQSHLFSIHFKTFVSCPHCGKKVGAKGLPYHIRRKHKPRVKDIVCDVCGACFATKSEIKNHMRKHTGERPFECKTCSKKFGFRAALYTHNKLKHFKAKAGENKKSATLT